MIEEIKKVLEKGNTTIKLVIKTWKLMDTKNLNEVVWRHKRLY